MAIAPDIFKLMNDTFEDLYGTVELTDEQINYYVKKYSPFVHKDMIKVAVNENDEFVGFILTLPNMSKALQKSRGRFLPFGWFHLLKGLRDFEVIDFYLGGIKKSYRGQGIDLLLVIEIVKTAMKMGFKYAESNLELEHNSKVQAMWKPFNPIQHRKRRIFKKELK
jgi:ribosomal protein S18 acetylase RimI-like enzyme